jgi:uncharacterized MAPEG superfamily protein
MKSAGSVGNGLISPPGDHAPDDGPRHSLLDSGAVAVLTLLAFVFVAPATIWVLWGPSLGPRNPVTIEMRALLWSALLCLGLVLLQIAIHIRRFGGDMVRGNRDDFPRLKGVAARVVRAHANLIESLVPFAAAIWAIQSLAISNRITVAAAVVFLAARVVHAASYVLGVTVVRSAAFYAGLVATVAVASQALGG